MAVTRKTITIPDAMEAWVKAQIESGRYGSDSEYFRDLIRHDQDRRAVEADLRSLVEEGLATGTSDDRVPDLMARVEDRMRADGHLPPDAVRPNGTNGCR